VRIYFCKYSNKWR